MEKRIFGYARVSSQEQNLDRQIDSLRNYVAEGDILIDKISGKSLDRPAYQALKGPMGLRRGDSLVITSLDRLSRNKRDIKDELQWFKENGIRLLILDLPTSLIEVPAGQQWILDMVQDILIEVLSSIAEQERKTIRKRQREGIEAAKRRGKHLGRPRISQPEQFQSVYEKWKQGKCTAKEAMNELGMKKSSFYRMVKKYEESLSQKIS